MLGLVAVCAAVASARTETTRDGNDSPGKFDFAKFVTTFSKGGPITVKFTLYDDVVDSDFTMEDATTPENDGIPLAFEGLEGNRLCAYIERRISPEKFPKYLLACTGRVTEGRLTGRLYRVEVGIKGKGVPIEASRSGRTVRLKIPNSKMPKANKSYSEPFTRYLGPGCADPCYDQEPGGEGER